MSSFRERHRTLLTYVATLAVALSFINSFWFMGESLKMGGDAGSGIVRDGRYYVGSRGKYSEVTREQWERSRFQGSVLAPMHLLGMAAMAYLVLGEVFPALLRSHTPAGNSDTVQRIISSGEDLASASCGGQVGSMSFSRGFLKVSVHPDGAVLKPAFMQPIGVPVASIMAVRERRLLFQRSIELTYSPPGWS